MNNYRLNNIQTENTKKKKTVKQPKKGKQYCVERLIDDTGKMVD